MGDADIPTGPIDTYQETKNKNFRKAVLRFIQIQLPLGEFCFFYSDIETNPGWQGTSSPEKDYLQEFARDINQRSSNLKIAEINMRSLRNEVDEIKLFLHECRFDILAITETHLDRKITNRQLEIDNYN